MSSKIANLAQIAASSPGRDNFVDTAKTLFMSKSGIAILSVIFFVYFLFLRPMCTFKKKWRFALFFFIVAIIAIGIALFTGNSGSKN